MVSTASTFFRMAYRLGPVLLVLAAQIASVARAADVTVTPATGDSVVVNGPVVMPAVPGAEQQSQALCIAPGGRLGPCAAGTGGNPGGGTPLPQNCTAGQTLHWSGAAWTCAAPAGGGVGSLPACEGGQLLMARPDGSGLACQTPASRTSTADSAGRNFFSSIAIGADGVPMISYLDGENLLLKIARCSDAACSTATTRVVDPVSGGWGNSIAIGADGLAVIGYWGLANKDLRVAKCSDVACSTVTLRIVDGSGNVGSFPSIAIGSDGLPVLSYYDAGNRHLKVAKCANAACSAPVTVSTVDSAADVGQHTAIAVGADGRPVIGYYDAANKALKVAKCGNAECSAPATVSTVGNANFVGSFTSIAIGADGLPVISYYDTRNLKVAKCSNAECSASLVSTVDGSGAVGQSTSIAIGADGLPLISYYDYGASGANLKVAKCSNGACSAATLSAVDSAQDMLSTSIAIGRDGLPVVSYDIRTSATTGALKVTKCSTVSCRQP